MNYSLLGSDRATHLKLGLTAVLATALVIVIGMYAQPPGAAHGSSAHPANGPTLIAKVDRGWALTH